MTRKTEPLKAFWARANKPTRSMNTRYGKPHKLHFYTRGSTEPLCYNLGPPLFHDPYEGRDFELCKI